MRDADERSKRQIRRAALLVILGVSFGILGAAALNSPPPPIVLEMKSDAVALIPDTTAFDLIEAAARDRSGSAEVRLDSAYPWIYARVDRIFSRFGGFSKSIETGDEWTLPAAVLRHLEVGRYCIVRIDRLANGWIRLGVGATDSVTARAPIASADIATQPGDTAALAAAAADNTMEQAAAPTVAAGATAAPTDEAGPECHLRAEVWTGTIDKSSSGEASEERWLDVPERQPVVLESKPVANRPAPLHIQDCRWPVAYRVRRF